MGEIRCCLCRAAHPYSESGVIDISDLSEPHKRALKKFVDKFKAGAREHGDLPTRHKWVKDVLDEEIDAAFYRIFALMSLEDNNE